MTCGWARKQNPTESDVKKKINEIKKSTSKVRVCVCVCGGRKTNKEKNKKKQRKQQKKRAIRFQLEFIPFF